MTLCTFSVSIHWTVRESMQTETVKSEKANAYVDVTIVPITVGLEILSYYFRLDVSLADGRSRGSGIFSLVGGIILVGRR